MSKEEIKYIPKCLKCDKEMEMAYDSILKRKSRFLWKGTCNCIPENWRLGIL